MKWFQLTVMVITTTQTVLSNIYVPDINLIKSNILLAAIPHEVNGRQNEYIVSNVN